MRKTILLAFALVAFVTMPAMASVQNVKIGGSIDSTWLVRNNFNLGAYDTVNANIGNENQNLLITQTMLTIDSDLTDNVSTTVHLINERVWTQKTPAAADATVDIHLAYATLREMLYSPLTVVAGRQAFHYGNSFILDSAGTNNSAPTDSGIVSVAGDLTKQTAMDAVRFIFDYEPLSIELLFSKITSRTNALRNLPNDDVDLYGMNAGYKVGDSMNTEVEAYFFAKNDKLANAATTSNKSDTVYVPGLRASTNPIEGLNVQAEVAWQRGNKVVNTADINENQQRDAMGAQIIANYQVPVLKEYKPILGYVYTYVSGDSNPGDVRAVDAGQRGNEASSNRWTAWDPMFENQAGGTIYNALFNLSNAHIHTVSAQVNPIEDVTAKVSWTNLRLDKGLSGNSANTAFTLVQPDSFASASLAVNVDEKAIGNEVDATLTYDYTEDVQFGANLGWFLPGDLFKSVNDTVASQAIIHGNVNF